MSEPESVDIASSIMMHSMENAAEALSFTEALTDGSMRLALKKSAVRAGIGEESVNFLIELRALQQAGNAAAPDLDIAT